MNMHYKTKWGKDQKEPMHGVIHFVSFFVKLKGLGWFVETRGMASC